MTTLQIATNVRVFCHTVNKNDSHENSEKSLNFAISFLSLDIIYAHKTKKVSLARAVREEKMDYKHSHGEVKNILEFDDDNKPIVVQETLDSIFNHPKVKNRHVVAFSVIGAFRKGKSFYLDYCLRYLYAHVSLL